MPLPPAAGQGLRRSARATAFLVGWLACSALGDGQTIADNQCRECHGAQGRSEDPAIPSIGGFSEYAIMDLLENFRLGFRRATPVVTADGEEKDMAQIAKALSEEDIEAVALYYAEQPWQPHDQPFDEELVDRGALVHARKCSKCHPESGSVAEADHALLSGQWRQYLLAQFRNFDDGSRRMADKMKAKYDTLSPTDKAALVELYVSGRTD